MRKEENTEKDELYGKLQVHFIENVEAEESSEEKESDSGNLSDEILIVPGHIIPTEKPQIIQQRSQYKRI
jgi:hypothetical protein